MTRRSALVGTVVLVVVLGLAVSVYLQRRLESEKALREFETEANNIADILQLQLGATVADVWAGDGRWSVDLAWRLGPEGHVYVIAGPEDPVAEIYANVAAGELDNITVVLATNDQPLGWLTADCCDAILMRNVCHDLPDRLQVTRQILDELGAEGRFALIDFEPDTRPDVPGHGIEQDVTMEEMESVGFEMTRSIRDWTDRSYCMVFEKSSNSSVPAPTP